MRLQPIQKLVIKQRANSDVIEISWTNKELFRLLVTICGGALRFPAQPIVETMLKHAEDVDYEVAIVLPNFDLTAVLETANAIEELAVGNHIPTEDEVEQLIEFKKKPGSEAASS